MKSVILFILILQVFQAARCAGSSSVQSDDETNLGASEEKGDPLNQNVLPDVTEKEIELEKEHKSIHPKEDEKDLYEKWSYLINKNLKKYCEDYLKDLYTGIEVNEVEARKKTVPLRYRMSNAIPDIKVSILMCKLATPHNGRTIFSITQALNPRCVFSLESVFEVGVSHYWFYIKDKSCYFEPSKHNNLPDITDEETELEQEHMSIHPQEDEKISLYKEWSYLKNKNLKKYCKDYLKDLFPDIEVNEVDAKKKTVPLRYRMTNAIPGFRVSILMCKLGTPHNGHTIFPITQALDPRCVLSLGSVFEKGIIHYWFYIKDKRCYFERSDDVSVTNQLISANEARRTALPSDENKTVVVAQNQSIQEPENAGNQHVQGQGNVGNENVQETENIPEINIELTNEELEKLRIENDFVPSASGSEM